VPIGRIREYDLLEQIGQGGMGTVYKASHTMLDRIVAVKLLPSERMNDAESVSRFRREMKAVGKLQHPNIVQAFDAGEERGVHYLVMEYVEGLDVAALQEQQGRLPIADACEIIRQAALGLQHAHEHGMVHRDIKPSNLPLAVRSQRSAVSQSEISNPGSAIVKILDLGLALLSDSDRAVSRNLTSTGQIMGTLDYMAPEQADDTHAVSIRADIYSLGCTLYALLAGEPPFGGERYTTPVRKLAAHMQKPVPRIREWRDDVPVELVTILMVKSPFLSTDRNHRDYLRLNPAAIPKDTDGHPMQYGALPPGPAPPEGDWFTQLQDRWKEAQADLKRLQE